MKRVILLFTIILFSFLLLSCGGGSTESDFDIERGGNGPLVDKIIFETRTDMNIAIKDVVAGKADLMATGVDGSVYLSLSQSDKAKLETYAVPSGSWSLLFNPYPNKAPYTVETKDGNTQFNPLAIKEIRYALNWLIDRKKIVDEVLKGAGEPSFTQATVGQPGTYPYNLIPINLGTTATGNEVEALEKINNAMIKASNLPENKGKLLKVGDLWQYNGEAVTLKMIIRVDDPTGRLPAGQAIADLIEKTGIKVDRLLYDRSKSTQLAYNTDPKNYEWNIITEAWGAGATRAWWDISLRQMYVPAGNNMPGRGVAGFWNYKNDEVTRLSDKNSNGRFLTSEEYWRDNLRIQKIGLEEAVRIYLNSQTQFFVANKEAFNSRMLYGVGDGINHWSMRTADIKPNKNGEKVLRVIQHSSQGSLFMSPWDPIGIGGFRDVYSGMIIGSATDAGAYFESPSTAKTEFILGEVDKNTVEIGVAPNPVKGGNPLGTVKVSPDSMLYNPYTEMWEKGKTIKVDGTNVRYVNDNNPVTYVKGVFKPKKFMWHHNIESSLVDLIYSEIFRANIVTKTSGSDKYYDAALASRYRPVMDGVRGSVINDDGSFEVYSKSYWPMDESRQLSALAISPKIGNPNRNTLIPFEINEAIMKMITEGSQSGTVYSLVEDQSFTPIDVKNPTCVADIKAKLIEMRDSSYVPKGVEAWLTVAHARERYNAAINFIDNYGHAYISNGPFFISKIDTKANYIELTAFRDYAYEMNYWIDKLSTTMSKIEDVDMPSIAEKTEDLSIEIIVSSYDYPSIDIKEPHAETKVRALLQLPTGGERVYNGVFEGDIYKINISKEDLKVLPNGSYTIVLESSIGDETPSIVTRNFALE